MRAITGLGVIENAGPNHLRGFLKQHIKTAKSVDIAVAFVTLAGLSDLLPVLKKASMNGSVRLLTGLYQCFTEPEALRVLLAEQTDTADRLSVRLSTDPHFHWKAYFLLKGGKATAVIGSSNLTAEGLGGSGEFNAVFSMSAKSPAYKSLRKPFEEEWKLAKPLHREQIDKYANARPKSMRVFQPSMSLKAILGGRPRQAERSSDCQYWRDWVTGAVADKTEEIVSESTNWDERRYLWYSSWEPRHKRGDRILLFDFAACYVQLVEVVDTTRTPIRTPDGQQFTAYRQVAKTHRRKLGQPLWRKLKDSTSITSKSDAQAARKLTSAVFERLSEVIEF